MNAVGLLGSALLMGLFGGAHCAVMCGSVSSVLCAPTSCAESDRPPLTLSFNAGRVLSYAMLGGVVASLSTLPLPPSALDSLRLGFRVLAALCMLSVGLHLVGLPSFVRLLESVGGPVWRRVSRLAKRLLPLQTPGQALAAGALWAFMPCGLLYAALALAASSTSVVDGALTMLAFGVGTLPVMATIGLAAGRLLSSRGKLASARGLWIRRAAGAFVLAFGLWSTVGVAQQAVKPTVQTCGAHEPFARAK